ncbi:beta-glucuronidase [Venturia canescens]|uniref:beta-glucuronidase n=1 Tax=Venturia canescens TaxID=32260 RepID=UPI001C9C84CB|nr:beta-glucuronidase [Venturia canescens]
MKINAMSPELAFPVFFLIFLGGNVVQGKIDEPQIRRRNSNETVEIFVGTAEALEIIGDETRTGEETILVRVSPAVVPKPPPPLPGLLYPRESESREVKTLDGLWDFVVSPSGDSFKGHREFWYQEALSKSPEVMQMPVPSSYNDVTTSRALRDHVGIVWYERTFFVPPSWADQRVFLYFGSVNYLAQVWLNGQFLTSHQIGHLPFEAEVTSRLIYGTKNRVTVAVDNRLTWTSIPQGNIVKNLNDNGTTSLLQTYTFDFFNYAGIHRPVLLYTKPRVYVEDITVKTSVFENVGVIEYSVRVGGAKENETASCSVVLRRNDDRPVVEEKNRNLTGVIRVPDAKLWWPRGMHPEPAHLYTLEVSVTGSNSSIHDIYRLPIGIRSLHWTNTSVLINGKPIYLRGFGRHEDSPIRGRGLDLVTMTRDYELLKWVGANSYRTSHYPYSDEVLEMADRQGILIVDECPAVDIENYSSELLTRHETALSELIRRDKNRPSVIMWSIANEPRSQLTGTEEYFGSVASHTRNLDPTRPITAALSRGAYEDKAGQFLDVIGFNRYNSWYSNTGCLDMIITNLVNEATTWNKRHNKPVIMFEYGADTVAGMHELPSYVWSEDYQAEMFSRHFMAFDRLRQAGFFIGEFIWNFADFRTAQTYTRAGGNKKGIFTRTREPKMAAYYVRKRYSLLGAKLDGSPIPDDLEFYVMGDSGPVHEEL